MNHYRHSPGRVRTGGKLSAADLLTLLRVLIIFAILLTGLLTGPAGLARAVVLLLVAWTTDYIDGPAARRLNHENASWLGRRDLQIDMAVAIAVNIYLILAGFLPLRCLALYLALWVLVFWRFGLVRLLAMFFQAPLYGAFVYTALTHAPQAGRWLLAWLVLAVLSPWPRFTPLWVWRELKNGLRELRGGSRRKI